MFSLPSTTLSDTQIDCSDLYRTFNASEIIFNAFNGLLTTHNHIFCRFFFVFSHFSENRTHFVIKTEKQAQNKFNYFIAFSLHRLCRTRQTLCVTEKYFCRLLFDIYVPKAKTFCLGVFMPIPYHLCEKCVHKINIGKY